MKKAVHKNIIRLLEVFENKQHIFFVMEYAEGGDLLQLIKKVRKMSERATKPLFKQITQAIKYCHDNNILHRDIKLDNILLHKSQIKLCDFGVSRLITPGQTIKEQCGTPAYIAPEIINRKGYKGTKADIWSFGVLLYAMLTGTVPFRSNNLQDLHKLILKGVFDVPVYVSSRATDLIRKMITLSPTKRISASQILSHPWLSSVQNSVQTQNQTGVTTEILENLVKIVQNCGFKRDFILKSLNHNNFSHA